jgi:hypothetical protein
METNINVIGVEFVMRRTTSHEGQIVHEESLRTACTDADQIKSMAQSTGVMSQTNAGIVSSLLF